MKNQRKRYLVDRKIQLPLLTRIVFIVIGVSAVFALGMYWVSRDMVAHIPYPDLREIYLTQMRYSLGFFTVMIAIGCFAIYALGILLSHQFAGPLVPIKRFIQALIDKDYDVPKLQLRQSDKLQDIAQKLNELRDSLHN